MVTNDTGQVAIRCREVVPHMIKIGKKGYFFVVQRAVCLGWIDSVDVPTILQMKRRNCNCGGGAGSMSYFYADEHMVGLWNGTLER